MNEIERNSASASEICAEILRDIFKSGLPEECQFISQPKTKKDCLIKKAESLCNCTQTGEVKILVKKITDFENERQKRTKNQNPNGISPKIDVKDLIVEMSPVHCHQQTKVASDNCQNDVCKCQTANCQSDSCTARDINESKHVYGVNVTDMSDDCQNDVDKCAAHKINQFKDEYNCVDVNDRSDDCQNDVDRCAAHKINENKHVYGVDVIDMSDDCQNDVDKCAAHKINKFKDEYNCVDVVDRSYDCQNNVDSCAAHEINDSKDVDVIDRSYDCQNNIDSSAAHEINDSNDDDSIIDDSCSNDCGVVVTRGAICAISTDTIAEMSDFLVRACEKRQLRRLTVQEVAQIVPEEEDGMSDAYGSILEQGDHIIDTFHNLLTDNRNLTVRISFSYCAKLLAVLLTLNTLFFSKVIIWDSFLQHLF